MYQSPEYTTAHVVIPPGDNPLPRGGVLKAPPNGKTPKTPVLTPPPPGGGGGGLKINPKTPGFSPPPPRGGGGGCLYINASR